MKKKIYIVLLSALFVCPTFAQGFESLIDKNSKSWTRSENLTDARAGKVQAPDIESMRTDPTPVGDTAWALILGLGLAYGAYALNRQTKKQH
ncbi:hypothetical protein M2138_000736 [Dysgonomonadaceae bacterium PH5-43]|nr:hypothetical protein [Dysgonomonadaceae bacterium PH5-43]